MDEGQILRSLTEPPIAGLRHALRTPRRALGRRGVCLLGAGGLGRGRRAVSDPPATGLHRTVSSASACLNTFVSRFDSQRCFRGSNSVSDGRVLSIRSVSGVDR